MSGRLALTLVALALACGPPQTPVDGRPADARPVFASNYPLAYFAERLLGSPEPVEFPTIAGDPAFWTPDRAQIARIQAARVLLFNGATYEKWAPLVALPDDRVTRTADGFRDRWIAIEKETTHSHGEDGEHSHAGTALATWLDLDQAARQLAAVRDALIAAELAPAADIRQRHDALAAELKALDARLLALGKSPARQRRLLASHPVYQYLARRYQLGIESLAWQPDSDPGEEAWKSLEVLQGKHAFTHMLWESSPLPATITRLLSLNVEVVVVDPCGNRPDSGDLLTRLRANVEALERALSSD